MNEPRPFASLSPSLLARKGAARPAMRPQLQPLVFEGSQHFADPHLNEHYLDEHRLNDLGWNDMGEGHDEPAPTVASPSLGLTPLSAADVVSQNDCDLEAESEELAPAPTVVALAPEPVAPIAQEPALSPVQAQLAALAQSINATARLIRTPATANGRKAAFTLRLDADRHLRLRLASTLQRRSAQQLLTEALDRVLDEIPGLNGLARQMTQN